MEDTWTDRDLPVLRAAVKVFNPDTTLGEDADPNDGATPYLKATLGPWVR